eukprot:TRINITY_DN6645_c0_g1_i1.p2 TRINITY_DN6645_c0_g1~~TRINITY_DN6645_c0_g1_i1.p2  ORF type:complete len:214 (+),score=59.31 TRINITY_DN6645_c0_g1_i1:41-643(+)
MAGVAASVWSLLVSDGDTVAAGDTLATLESMKVELAVEAPMAGVVRRVAVAAGDRVAADSRLCDVAAPSTAAATRSDDLRRSNTSATLDERVERWRLTHAASVGHRPQHLGDTSVARSVSAAWMAAAMSGGHRHAVAASPTPTALLPLLLLPALPALPRRRAPPPRATPRWGQRCETRRAPLARRLPHPSRPPRRPRHQA